MTFGCALKLASAISSYSRAIEKSTGSQEPIRSCGYRSSEVPARRQRPRRCSRSAVAVDNVSCVSRSSQSAQTAAARAMRLPSNDGNGCGERTFASNFRAELRDSFKKRYRIW